MAAASALVANRHDPLGADPLPTDPRGRKASAARLLGSGWSSGHGETRRGAPRLSASVLNLASFRVCRGCRVSAGFLGLGVFPGLSWSWSLSCRPGCRVVLRCLGCRVLPRRPGLRSGEELGASPDYQRLCHVRTTPLVRIVGARWLVRSAHGFAVVGGVPATHRYGIDCVSAVGLHNPTSQQPNRARLRLALGRHPLLAYSKHRRLVPVPAPDVELRWCRCVCRGRLPRRPRVRHWRAVLGMPSCACATRRRRSPPSQRLLLEAGPRSRSLAFADPAGEAVRLARWAEVQRGSDPRHD